MSRHLLTFVNHACFMTRSESALLLVDPWLEGPAFNNGWSLLDQSTSSSALIAQLNQAGVPVYIWYSHEHPDHFSIPFIKKLKEEFRGQVEFLFQETLDKRVVGFLKRNGFAVTECRDGVPVALGHDMRITVFPYESGDSWCLINCGERSILNLNDCALTTAQQCRAVKAKVATLAPRIDLLFTQFGYANWVGNPDQPGLRRAAANEKLERIALQMTHLNPNIAIPFASFVYFSNTDNAYLNEGQNRPRAVADAPRLAGFAHAIRFLQPGSTVDLDADSAASLAATHEQALAHWTRLLDGDLKLLPSQAPASVDDVRGAFMAYRDTVRASLPALPWLLEATRRLHPLVIRLSDLDQTVELSYRRGFRLLDGGRPFHVSMSSANAVFLLKNEYGFDTTHVNGRFRLAHGDALSVFSRFFLPQRMGKNGFGVRHPMLTARFLARSAWSRATRQVQAVSL